MRVSRSVLRECCNRFQWQIVYRIHYSICDSDSSVILNDATREGNFINEPYIQHHQTQSLLCLPLLNQDKLVGVLYLENQVATGHYTARSQVLNLLSTQAAIAIENAKLYSKLRASRKSDVSISRSGSGGVAVDVTSRPHYFNQRANSASGTDPSVTWSNLQRLINFIGRTDQQYPLKNCHYPGVERRTHHG